jgi:hypothetical protein
LKDFVLGEIGQPPLQLVAHPIVHLQQSEQVTSDQGEGTVTENEDKKECVISYQICE